MNPTARRGSLPHVLRAQLDRRARQVWRPSYPPREAPAPLAVFATSCCYGFGAWQGVERATLTTLTRRGIPLCRLPYIVYYFLAACLPPAGSRPQQDSRTTILNCGHEMSSTTTTCRYFLWCQLPPVVLHYYSIGVKDRHDCKEGSGEEGLHLPCQQRR